MPAYMIEIEHRETDQVFSYYHGDKMLHFNATLLSRLHKQMPAEFRRITLDLNQETYDLCMKHRGIEEPRLEKLAPADLRNPGYGVLFNDGAFVTIDGHHRLVRRWRGGVRVMDFWITREEIWTHCLVEYTAEGEERIAKAIPERVDSPRMIANHVTVHPQ